MDNKIMTAKLDDLAGDGNSKVYVEGNNDELQLPESFVLVNRPKRKKNSKLKEFIFGNPNVGKSSAGFSLVITLAIFIAFIGAIVAFFALKY